MTGKRFQYNVNKNTIEQDGKFVAYMNCVDGVRIANKLTVFQEENEQLKKENLDLSEELDYYKTKCASLETGLFQADRETEQLKFENENLKVTIQARDALIEVCEKKFRELGYIITVDDDGYVIE